MNTFSKTLLLSISILSGISFQSFSAPGILSDLPPDITSGVSPNMLLVVDDSKSMESEVLYSNGASIAYPSYVNGAFFAKDIVLSPATDLEYLEACSGFNVMYFDPKIDYVPWKGKDIDDNTYGDQPLTAARNNPYEPAEGTINLNAIGSSAGYLPWVDANDNGEFDLGECSDVPTTNMATNFVTFNSMSAEDKQNFANWYSYYRKREYLIKSVLSRVIAQSSVRMGVATLNNNNNVGQVVNDIGSDKGMQKILKEQAKIQKENDKDQDEDKKKEKIKKIEEKIEKIEEKFGISANKAHEEALLESVSRIDSDGFTPMREAFKRAGDYFDPDESVDPAFFGGPPVHDPTETFNAGTPVLKPELGGSCQQNFSVLLSDGYWNGADPGGSNNTLADIAQRLYENDLTSSLNDDLNVEDPQTGTTITHQNVITYAVTFGVNGTLSVNPDEPGFTSWPTPVSNTATTIDDMRHAAWNGRGEFLSAGNPQELINSFGKVITDAQIRAGSLKAGEFGAGSISTDSLLFQSQYNTVDYTGDLLAFSFDNSGIVDSSGNGSKGNEDAHWSAATELSSRLGASSTAWASRNIITYNGTQGVPFAFPTDYTSPTTDEISSSMISDLLSHSNAPYIETTTDPAEIASNKTFGENIVAFLKGDKTNEGSIFYDRKGKYLGPIIYSSPQYMGVPNQSYPNLIEGTGNEYSTFINDNSARTPMVFVGGNDGMLHGFDATTGSNGGKEIFAYIPNFFSNNLSNLAEINPIYNSYVDATPTIRDVFVNSAWRTYLVGGTRSGGKGIYVLDVTNDSTAPLATASASAANAKKIILKEFTHSDLGFTFSRPQIAKLANNRWAAIFGNGYNNSGDGKAKLFILYLDDFSHKILNTNIGVIANNDCLDSGSNCNGLSSPTIVDLNGDYKIDRVYAGDVHGNLWVFNLEDSDPANWAVAYGGDPFFQACLNGDCSDPAKYQPITAKPVVSRHPYITDSSTSPNVMVYFGTGQNLADGDEKTTDLQAFYAVWDADSSDINDKTYSKLKKNNLVQQEFSDSLTITSNAVNYGTGSGEKFGWYVNLATTGTNVLLGGRSVLTPLLIGDIIFFIVSVPDSGVCTGNGTKSYLATLEAVDGSQVSGFNVYTASSPALQLLSAPVVGMTSVGGKIIKSHSDSTVDNTDVQTLPPSPASRQSWSISR